MINISCSDLIKKSAKTICYFRKKQESYKVTERMLKGNEKAERRSISEFKEMRGTYVFENFLLHYTFDEIQLEKGIYILLEHKNIEEGSVIEDWYLNSSILQTALYQSLLIENPSKEYFTAKFFRKQGFNTNYLKIEGNIKSVLWIGEKKYKVIVNNSKEIVKFFCKKAKATLEYESAITWDLTWKFKEYQYLKQYIKFKQ